MQNPCTRNLILAIGGAMRPGEGVKGYLRRVAQIAGLGFRSTERAWYRQEPSRPTITKLQEAAENANNVAARVETLATDLSVDRRFLAEADALRDLARRLRYLDRGVGGQETTEE
jgi:hypothetical protein